MLNLQEVKDAIDYLSPEERAELRAYLDEHETLTLRAGTMDIDVLIEAVRVMHEGLTESEWDEIVQAMNE
jgi:hypothetical protein